MNHMNRLIFLIILGLSWSQLANAQQSCAISPNNCSVLMMVGDSITYGIPVIPRSFRNPDDGLGDNFGPSVLELQRLLNESLRPSVVINWGLGGSSSLNGLDRINGIISNSVSRYPASRYFTLIQYGTNDQNFGFSSSTTKANVRAMVIASRNRGVTPVLSNLPPRSDENVASRNQVIGEVAIELSVPGVNNFSNLFPLSQFFVPEGGVFLHPNQAGYNRIAGNWFNNQMKSLIAVVPLPEPEPEPAPTLAPITNLLLDDEE